MKKDDRKSEYLNFARAYLRKYQFEIGKMDGTLNATPIFAHGALFHEYDPSHQPIHSGNRCCPCGLHPPVECTDQSSAAITSGDTGLRYDDIYIVAVRLRGVEWYQRRSHQYPGACRGECAAHQCDYYRCNGNSGSRRRVRICCRRQCTGLYPDER